MESCWIVPEFYSDHIRLGSTLQAWNNFELQSWDRPTIPIAVLTIKAAVRSLKKGKNQLKLKYLVLPTIYASTVQCTLLSFKQLTRNNGVTQNLHFRFMAHQTEVWAENWVLEVLEAFEWSWKILNFSRSLKCNNMLALCSLVLVRECSWSGLLPIAHQNRRKLRFIGARSNCQVTACKRTKSSGYQLAIVSFVL